MEIEEKEGDSSRIDPALKRLSTFGENEYQRLESVIRAMDDCENLVSYEMNGKLIVVSKEYSRFPINDEDYDYERRSSMGYMGSFFMKYVNTMRRTVRENMEKELFFIVKKILSFQTVDTAKEAGCYIAFGEHNRSSIQADMDVDDLYVVLDIRETERDGEENNEANLQRLEDLTKRFPRFSLTLHYLIDACPPYLFPVDRNRKRSSSGLSTSRSTRQMLHPSSANVRIDRSSTEPEDGSSTVYSGGGPNSTASHV